MKPLQKKKVDEEIRQLSILIESFDKAFTALLKTQDRCGVKAKVRISKYLLSRFEGDLNWMKEE